MLSYIRGSKLTETMLLIESGVVILILLLAFLRPQAGSSLFAFVERGLAQLARQRRFSVLVVGVAALGIRAAMLPILPIPYPGLNDEFSYQLMADTFAHGRLTNPTHPMWIHFENVLVIHRPTYCSIYYPAHGIFLALGEIVAGHPFWGVWLSVGLMCAAICWMLQGWVSPLWALLGGLLAVIRIAAFSYWNNSYWGGAVTALGGALVLGALPRIKKTLRIRDALLMGVGFSLLVNSRPYETLFFVLPIGMTLVVWMLKSRANITRQIWRFVLPLSLVLIWTAGFMAYYFWRTTGNPFLPPYIINFRTYGVDPNFAWLPLRPVPEYHHEMIRRHYIDFDVGQYLLARAHPVFACLLKPLMVWFFFLGPLLSLPFLGLALALPYDFSVRDLNGKTRLLLIICGVTLAGMVLVVPSNPHYAAALTAAIYALLALAMQQLRRWRLHTSRSGIFVVRAVSAGAVLLLSLRIVLPLAHLHIENPAAPWTWCSPWFQLLPRASVENKLRSMNGQHLVLVHYSEQHDEKQGWVNNSADIDNSKIVWAYDMEPKQNEELIRYFLKRHVWIVYPDEDPMRLVPYDLGLGFRDLNEIPK